MKQTRCYFHAFIIQQQKSTMSDKKTIYLTRHGETEFNRLGIVQGSGVDSALNDKGRQQAELFFEHYGNLHFDRVYTSTLQRTYQSVQRFIEDKQHPHTAFEGLDEIKWGIYEGKPSTPEQKAVYLAMVRKWQSGDLKHSIPGGENPIELQERQKPVLQHILAQQQEQQILICMHGRALRSFLCLMMETPLSQMDRYGHRNLGLYLIRYENNKFFIEKENDGKHLQSLAL